jgi:hypothetical protein
VLFTDSVYATAKFRRTGNVCSVRVQRDITVARDDRPTAAGTAAGWPTGNWGNANVTSNLNLPGGATNFPAFTHEAYGRIEDSPATFALVPDAIAGTLAIVMVGGFNRNLLVGHTVMVNAVWLAD